MKIKKTICIAIFCTAALIIQGCSRSSDEDKTPAVPREDTATPVTESKLGIDDTENGFEVDAAVVGLVPKEGIPFEDLRSALEDPNPQLSDMTKERFLNNELSRKKFEENKEKYGNDSNYFVAHGLLANKREQTVQLDAYTTGVGPRDIAEFFIITVNSGHSYEALLVAQAKADDICKAVEFIGVPRGRGVNYRALRFWPKGERVLATVSIEGSEPVPLETMVRITETDEPLSTKGFVYVGDQRDENDIFIGDSDGPGSIMSTYNEPITVFDVPRKAPQTEVYENYTVSENFPKIQDAWADIVLSPEKRSEKSPKRLRDVTLAFSNKGVSLDSADPVSIGSVLNELQKSSDEDQRDIHAELVWGNDLTISEIREISSLLSIIDVEGGICIGPPVKGQPYYKAFTPDEQWRERSDRYMQPCELRFDEKGEASIIGIEEIWQDDQLRPELKTKTTPDVTVETLPQLVKENSPEYSPTVFVFAPKNLEYGKIAPFLEALPEEFFDIHIFME
ncbi:MAG: hypothetical protein GX804_00030 [Lentisphaerae bacterium]|jgi:hypothetical protein|nr:hypothetical protein [Lentisphaerota bacterium]